MCNRDNIGPQLPGQASRVVPPVGYTTPQYFNQPPYTAPGMYSPNIMAPPISSVPPITSIPPSTGMTPAVRKQEDGELGPEKKPRLEEPEEIVPDVCILSIDLRSLLIVYQIEFVFYYHPNT